jgi:hypothetical protein
MSRKPLSGAAKATIWVGVIGAVSAIAVAIIQQMKTGDKTPPESSPTSIEVRYSDWKTVTGHHQKHTITYGRGTFNVAVSPTRTKVYVKICIKQPAANKEACSLLTRPYESGPVRFEVNDNSDWHLKKDGPVLFTACAYRSMDDKSLINCSDPHEEPAHSDDASDE